MKNYHKDVIIYDARQDKLKALPESTINSLLRSKNHSHYTKQGYVKPDDCSEIWYIDESERSNGIKNNKPFLEQFKTGLYFKLVERIDNKFIQGYIGDDNQSLAYIDETHMYLTFIRDYYERKKVYFTFDKVTLYRLIEIHREKPLRFNLQREEIMERHINNQFFMIMPFGDQKLNEIYKEQLKSFIENKIKGKIFRADDFRNNDIIIDTIYKCIQESEIIIAEISENNKNVFYELGYASAKGKEIIMIQNRNKSEKLFFDRAHIRTIFYDLNNFDEFLFDLESTIAGIRARY